MKTHFKNFTVGKTTSVIKVEHENSENTITISEEIKALSILLGGYNEFGRKIDIKTFENIKHRFQTAIQDIMTLM